MKAIITSVALVLGFIFASNATDPQQSVHNYKQMGASNRAKQEMRLAGTQKVSAVNRTSTNSSSYKNNFKKYDYSYEMVPATSLSSIQITPFKKNYKHQF
jgi:hypothetical protein